MPRDLRLRTVLTLFFVGIILFLAMLVSVLDLYVVKRYIFDKAQEQVSHDLETARKSYDHRLNEIKILFEAASPFQDMEELKGRLGIDYLFFLNAEEAQASTSEIVRKAFNSGVPVEGTRLVMPEELAKMGPGYVERASIPVRPTPHARPSQKSTVDMAMAIEYAKPLRDWSGKVTKVVYGGKIINRNFELIDEITEGVFESRLYNGKPVGTVTVFLDDVRVATNVLDSDGERAIGTRVSDEVYRRVVEKGGRWQDRAFVVTNWYITAYEPIRDINGEIIGILYVGILEQPFIDLGKNIFVVFLGVIAVVVVLAVAGAFFLTAHLSRPLLKTIEAATSLAEGDMSYRIEARQPIREFNDLMNSFNAMAHRIDQRENSLKEAKEKLEAMNESYLDLVGFVSHELKGILASLVLNTYSMREGLLGPINEHQKKILSAMSKNLDYLSATVKNFLSLSRIEKGELKLSCSEILFRDTVIAGAIDSFQQLADEKDMRFINMVDSSVKLTADPALLQVVVNNLISNAIKYGRKGGAIEVSARDREGMLQVEVYNDGRPIEAKDMEKLFKKFSRIHYFDMEKVKGTGVGLFITKEIIEKHGGQIWVESRDHGNAFIFNIRYVSQNS